MSIDYGNGLTNRDLETGIRYGVINQNHVLQAWADSSEPEYACKDCDAWDAENEECTEDCPDCEPVAWNVDADGLLATCSEDGDIFVLRSPFYTYAAFCSPCAPGACWLVTPVDPDPNNKCYCLGQDWFDESYEPCPYPVWRVDTDEQVYTPGDK